MKTRLGLSGIIVQVGLAGSSAIVTATLKCLMAFFNLTEADLPKEVKMDKYG